MATRAGCRPATRRSPKASRTWGSLAVGDHPTRVGRAHDRLPASGSRVAQQAGDRLRPGRVVAARREEGLAIRPTAGCGRLRPGRVVEHRSEGAKASRRGDRLLPTVQVLAGKPRVPLDLQQGPILRSRHHRLDAQPPVGAVFEGHFDRPSLGQSRRAGRGSPPGRSPYTRPATSFRLPAPGPRSIAGCRTWSRTAR